jgi:NAD(P)-dependent dehydrogenase (short-subunit alcohol dehydrogenase family)
MPTPPAFDKAVLITGCSSGIGRASALSLQARGYRVIASCRKDSDVKRLQQDGLDHVVPLDLTSTESIKRGVAQALDIAGGRLFGLFNNGAYGQPGAVEDLTRDALRRQFETNLFGTHELTRELLPHFLQQDDARIIQNSSVLGLVALPYRGAYNASKFALEGLTDTLRLELKNTPVRVCLIEPGPITSDFRKNALEAFEREIDIDSSRHRASYQQSLKRLRKQGPATPFTLPAEAVVKKLIHALESPRPRPRYYVTFPTYLMGTLRRFTSSRILDRLVVKLGNA